jgi:hypothetical protein
VVELVDVVVVSDFVAVSDLVSVFLSLELPLPADSVPDFPFCA